MKLQRGSIAGPSLHGLWGRSAMGHNIQAAAEKSRQYGEGLDAKKTFDAFRQGEVFFYLIGYGVSLNTEPRVW